MNDDSGLLDLPSNMSRVALSNNKIDFLMTNYEEPHQTEPGKKDSQGVVSLIEEMIIPQKIKTEEEAEQQQRSASSSSGKSRPKDLQLKPHGVKAAIPEERIVLKIEEGEMPTLRKKVCRKICEILSKDMNLSSNSSKKVALALESRVNSVYPYTTEGYLSCIKGILKQARACSTKYSELVGFLTQSKDTFGKVSYLILGNLLSSWGLVR